MQGDVVQVGRMYGFEHSRTQKILRQWLAQEERSVEKVNTPETTIGLNVRRAEVYRDMGLAEAAREAFTDAAQNAWGEGMYELSWDLQDEAANVRDE